MSDRYWEICRIQYQTLGDLCQDVDASIAPITVIALGNNLYFICVQLLWSVK